MLLPTTRDRFKNRLRSFYYTHFRSFGFACSYQGDHFRLREKRSGTVFKTYFNPYWNELCWVVRYFGRHRPQEGDIVIDGGAYLGLFSLYAAALVGGKGRVIALEPDPRNYRELLKNIGLNGFDNVTALNEGLWSTAGERDFFENGVFSSFTAPALPGAAPSRCRATTVDSVVRALALPRVDFIKLDVEGAELEAIEGAAETLQRHSPRLAVASYHIVGGIPTHGPLEGAFSALGYDAESDLSVPHITTYARKKSNG